MEQDAELFAALAGIAGVFVGFGSLIGFTRRDEIDPAELGLFRAVVTIGLVVIVAALVPVALGRYGLEGRALWLVCSLLFLLLVWGGIGLAMLNPENRAVAREELRTRTATTLFFWVALELPIQACLILAVLGVWPGQEPALYTSALVLHVFEAAFVLAQLVYSQAGEQAGS